MSNNIYLTTTGEYSKQDHLSFIEDNFLVIHKERRSRHRDNDGHILPITITLQDVRNVLNSLLYHDFKPISLEGAKTLNDRVLAELWDTEELRDYYTTATIESVAA